MTKKKKHSGLDTELRQRAEEIALSPENLEAMSPEETRKMVHELQVHQIELELQNEELRHVQVELDAAATRYFDFYDLAPVGYFTISEKGLILDANLTAATFLDVSRSDLLKQPLSRYISNEDTDILCLRHKQLLETATRQDWDTRMLKKDGTTFWARLEAIAAKDAVGSPTCRIVMSEITDRKQTKKTLRQAEEKYRPIFDNAVEGIFQTTPEGRFLFANPALAKMFGYESPEELMGAVANIGNQIYVNQEKRLEHLRKLNEKGSVKNYETEMYRKDGSIIWVSINTRVVGNQAGKFLWYEGFIVDITERRQMEESLKLSRERLEDVQRTAKIGNWEANLVTGELYWSQVIFDIFGYDSKSFKPSVEAFYEAVHPDDREIVLESETRSEQTGLHDVVHRIINTKGEIRFVHELAKRYHDDKGKLIMLRGTVQDITDRKLAEDQVNFLLAEKELLLREVHHRIKNHMNVIMSLLSLQSSTMEDNPPAAAALEDSRSRVQSMMVLYDKLYRSSDFRAISTKEYLTSLINEIVGNFPKRQLITVEKQIDDTSLSAKTLSPIGMILNELLTNTMKYAFVGREDGLIRVSFSAKDNHASLIVQDNGMGIPESIDIGASSGFGMQLVDILTKQLEGTIRLEGENGTKFVLEFDV